MKYLSGRRRVFLFCLAAATTATPCLAQQPGAHETTLSAAVGVANVPVSELRTLYGSWLISVGGQLDIRVHNRVNVFFGISAASGEGDGQEVSGRSNLAGAVDFRQISTRFGIGWRTDGKPWTFVVGAGGFYDRYREKWRSHDLQVDGHSIGLLGQLMVLRSISKRTAVLARGQLLQSLSSDFEGNLGGSNSTGFELAAGVAVRF